MKKIIEEERDLLCCLEKKVGRKKERSAGRLDRTKKRGGIVGKVLVGLFI